jgi:hypothetical protein
MNALDIDYIINPRQVSTEPPLQLQFTLKIVA